MDEDDDRGIRQVDFSINLPKELINKEEEEAILQDKDNKLNEIKIYKKLINSYKEILNFNRSINIECNHDIINVNAMEEIRPPDDVYILINDSPSDSVHVLDNDEATKINNFKILFQDFLIHKNSNFNKTINNLDVNLGQLKENQINHGNKRWDLKNHVLFRALIWGDMQMDTNSTCFVQCTNTKEAKDFAVSFSNNSEQKYYYYLQKKDCEIIDTLRKNADTFSVYVDYIVSKELGVLKIANLNPKGSVLKYLTGIDTRITAYAAVACAFLFKDYHLTRQQRILNYTVRQGLQDISDNRISDFLETLFCLTVFLRYFHLKYGDTDSVPDCTLGSEQSNHEKNKFDIKTMRHLTSRSQMVIGSYPDFTLYVNLFNIRQIIEKIQTRYPNLKKNVTIIHYLQSTKGTFSKTAIKNGLSILDDFKNESRRHNFDDILFKTYVSDLVFRIHELTNTMSDVVILDTNVLKLDNQENALTETRTISCTEINAKKMETYYKSFPQLDNIFERKRRILQLGYNDLSHQGFQFLLNNYDSLIENNWPISNEKYGKLNNKFDWRYKSSSIKLSDRFSNNSSDSSLPRPEQQIKTDEFVDQNRQLLPIGVIFDKSTVFKKQSNELKNANEWRIKSWKFVDLKDNTEIPVINSDDENNNDYFVPLPDLNHVENAGERDSDLYVFIGQSGTGKTTIQKIWMFFMQLFIDEKRFKNYIYLNSAKNDIHQEDFCEMNGIKFLTYDQRTVDHDNIRVNITHTKEATVIIDDITARFKGNKFSEFFNAFVANRSQSKLNCFCSLQTVQNTGRQLDLSYFKSLTKHVVFTAKTSQFTQDFSTVFYRIGDTNNFISAKYANVINDHKENIKPNEDKITVLFYPYNKITCSEMLFDSTRHYWSQNDE